MTGIFVKNEVQPAQIIATGYYGCSFNVSVYDQNDNIYLFQNILMEELKEPITAFITNNISNQVISEDLIELSTVAGLNVSDRVQIGNYIYSISNISGSSIKISKGLYENIPSGTTVQRVGNLGIYKTDLIFVDIGIYTLIGKDSVFGLSSSQMIKVVPKSVETMYKDIKNLEYAILGG